MKRLVLFFLISTGILFASTIHFTQEEKEFIKTHKPITIASINSYVPFSFIKNGKSVGFTHDLIEIISQKSGLHFQKTTGSWSEIFTQFQEGKVDIISEISLKEQRLDFTHFTKPYYEIPIGVFANSDSKKYVGISSLQGKRLAILKDSFLISNLQKIKGLKLLFYSSNKAKFDALKNGEVDFTLSSAMYLSQDKSLLFDGIKLVGYFNYDNVKKEDLRFGIQKSKPLLASIINKTFDSIPFSTFSKLEEEWIYLRKEENILGTLTNKEKKWIQNNTISIGIEEARPYIYFNERKNIIDGLYADILKLVLNKTGLQVNFIRDSWDNLLQRFKAKELDLLPATFYSKEREMHGLFSPPFYQVREYIYIQNKNNNIQSLNDLKNKKVAIVKGYATINKLKEKFPLINMVETNNLQVSTSMLLNGKVDALIDYHLVVETYLRENSIVGIKGIAQSELYATSVHFLSHVDKPILQSILKKGLDAISREEESKILRQWVRVPYGENEELKTLTQEEKKFLENHPIIRLRVRPNRPPFEFSNNGKAEGLAVDYVKKAAKNVGLNIKFVLNDDPIHEAYDTIEKNRDQYDSLLLSVKSPQREKRFSFGVEYLSYPMMIITHKDSPYISSLEDLKGTTVALEKGFLTSQWIRRDYPSIEINPVATTKDALLAVHNKEAFAYVGNLGVASYMSKFEDLNNIKIAAPTQYGNVNFSFIAPKQWPELTSLLSKGYKQITPAEHSAIQQKWFALQTIEKTNYTLIAQILIGAIFVILWILWWNRKLANERNKTKEALEQLKLAQEEKLKSQQLLFNQSKIAAMGEMIGNIAHQWRQPLSVISTISTGALMQKEMGVLDDEKLETSLNTITQHTQYLSSTIDTFRDYIKTNKEYKRVILQERIQVAINIIQASYANNFITIKTNIDKIEPISIKLVMGELSEVLINLLNNSKDAVKENKTKDPWVSITIEKLAKSVVIYIEDNAGGIPDDVLPKIFEPYFTTKHQTQGTGLGLHMSYKIVTESLNGKINVSNSQNGALFTIELPCEE